MLNKKICKKCHNRFDVEWDTHDDNAWIGDFVWCKGNVEYADAIGWCKTKDAPPDICPYGMEQIVAQRCHKC